MLAKKNEIYVKASDIENVDAEAEADKLRSKQPLGAVTASSHEIHGETVSKAKR